MNNINDIISALNQVIDITRVHDDILNNKIKPVLRSHRNGLKSIRGDIMELYNHLEMIAKNMEIININIRKITKIIMPTLEDDDGGIIH